MNLFESYRNTLFHFSFQKETLYKEVLYTITHKLGTTSSASTQAANQLTNQLIQLQQRNPNAISAALAPLWQSVAAQSNTEKKTQQLGKKELYEYAQEAFQVDKDTHDRLLEEVHVEKVRREKLKTIFFLVLLYHGENISLYFISF